MWGASLAKASAVFKTKPLAFKYGFKEQLSQSIKDIKKSEDKYDTELIFNKWVELIETKTNLSKTRSPTIIVAAATAEAIARRNKRLVDALTREIILIKVLIQKMQERNAAKQAIPKAATAAAGKVTETWRESVQEPPNPEILFPTIFKDSERRDGADDEGSPGASAITGALNHATVRPGEEVKKFIQDKLTEYFNQKLISLDNYIKEIKNARIVNLVTSFICSTVVTDCEYDMNTKLKYDIANDVRDKVEEERIPMADGSDAPVEGYRLPDENSFGFNLADFGQRKDSVNLLGDYVGPSPGKIPCWRRAIQYNTSDKRCNRSDFGNPPCSSVRARDISLAADDNDIQQRRDTVHDNALYVKDGCDREIMEKLGSHISQKLKTLLKAVNPVAQNPVSFEEWTTLNEILNEITATPEVFVDVALRLQGTTKAAPAAAAPTAAPAAAAPTQEQEEEERMLYEEKYGRGRGD